VDDNYINNCLNGILYEETIYLPVEYQNYSIYQQVEYINQQREELIWQQNDNFVINLSLALKKYMGLTHTPVTHQTSGEI
jgi:hypothetical protein